MLANRSTFQARRDDQWQRWIVRQPLPAVALSLMVVALWLLTHRYKSLEGDAELYGVQALARIHLNLYVDLFLRNTSQDTYTVFSPFYAWCIGLIGLRKAALALTVAFKIWFFLASWLLARQLSNNGIAFVTISLLIITTGAYGAYDVFHYAEDWLTARSLGEALVISAFALYFHGFRAFGTLVASIALFVHPLIALPGVLLIICLWMPVRLGVLGAASGVLAARASLSTRSGSPRPVISSRYWTRVGWKWCASARSSYSSSFGRLPIGRRPLYLSCHCQSAQWCSTRHEFVSCAHQP